MCVYRDYIYTIYCNYIIKIYINILYGICILYIVQCTLYMYTRYVNICSEYDSLSY